jgi:hypothetical protein
VLFSSCVLKNKIALLAKDTSDSISVLTFVSMAMIGRGSEKGKKEERQKKLTEDCFEV